MLFYCETEDSCTGPAGVRAHFDTYSAALLWAFDELFEAVESSADSVSLTSEVFYRSRVLEARDKDGMIVCRVTVCIDE